MEEHWLENVFEKYTNMNYSYGTYSTRGDQVATAILEAYADGIAFETLIKKK